MTSKLNVFCKVKFLNGRSKIYQFPNDLREALLVEDSKELRRMLKDRLINVPVSPYLANKEVKLSVAKITHVFRMNKTYSPHRRTRGQFIETENSVRFLLHDYSFRNKLRIRTQYYLWKLKKKMKRGK